MFSESLHQQCGLWAETAPPPCHTTQLSEPITADVAVIGAGYSGLSTALHLADYGASVVVVEAGETGFGGSGRSVGLVNAGMWLPPDEVSAALGPPFGERLLGELGAGPQAVFDLINKHGIACEVMRTGTLHCANNASGVRELERRATQWQARGAPVRILSAAETTRMTGAQGLMSSLLDLRAGTIQPLAYVRGLARAGIKAGVRIFTRSAALGVDRSNGIWTVGTEKGSVQATWVVVATDMYSTHPWALLRTEQVRLPYFNIATKPLTADLLRTILPGRQGAWDTRKILSSFRLDCSGRLIFGSVGQPSSAGTDVHTAWARRAIAALFPQLSNVPFEWRWHGSIGMTNNSLPRLHRLAPNMLAMNGYNGRGIAPGTVFGRLMAQFISGRVTERDLPLPITRPKSATFRTPRELFYQAGSHIAHLVQLRFG
jgi:glycine/D-amino acid oxidase-like deaminating enzyme